MLDNNFKIRLEMLSDWQVGTGAGIPGSIDELVSKDVEGFPQVPAKTIVGIWRDALERLTLGLDNGNKNGNWQKWVETIFGNQPNERGANPTIRPIPAKLSLMPARISPSLRKKIGDDKRFKQALTFVKVGVEIEADSGTSKSQNLRFDEMGRIGTILEANVELEKTNETISALLILSAKLVERIGGKRRRGTGKCKLSIDDITEKDEQDSISWLKNKGTDSDKSKPIEKVSITQNSSDWQMCEYTLTLETPVSIVTAVLGNVSETLDFIPGTYLISHFVKHCGQDFFNAILDSNLQILPATICIEGNRGFPVPKVFAKEKMKQEGAEKEEVYNRLHVDLKDKKQTKPMREGYISDLSSSTLAIASTPQTLLMHNAVDDEVQRPTSDVVGVYSREAIQAGTVLKGEIRFRNLAFDDIKNFNGRVRLGTSKKDDYGWAQLKLEPQKELETHSATHFKPNVLVVYLASDVVLRNGNLRQTNLVENLAETLGLQAEKIKYQQIQVRRIESWQTSWGFPRPSLTLMQAGSVVVFETSRTLILDELKQIEKNGIGERRGEGYGQIIFNPKILEISKPNWQKGELTKADNPNNGDEIEDKGFAELIEETAWREELKIAVSKIAANEDLRREIFGFEIETRDGRKVSVPPMAQIGGLRSAVMRLQGIEDKQLVLKWLERLKARDNRIEKWDKSKSARQGKILVDGKLISLFDNPDKVWEILFKKDEKDNQYFKLPKDLNLGTNLKTALWAKAVKSLFYACQQAHKRDTEPKKEDENNGAEN